MIVVGKYKLADALARQIGQLLENFAGLHIIEAMATSADTDPRPPLRELEPLALARVHRFRARRALHNGDPGAYVDGLLLAEEAFAAAGDLRNATNERMNLGFAYAELGDYAKAEEVLRAAHAVAKKMALRTVIAWADNNLGNVLGLLGRYDEAMETEQRAIEAGKNQGDPRLEGNSRIYMSAINQRAGSLDAALAEACTAVSLLAAIPSLRALALAAESRAWLSLGRSSEAVTSAKEAMRLLEELGALEEGESLLRLVYAEALHAAGETELAKRSLARARDRLRMRAKRIADARFRESFLTAVPENARTLRLAEEWQCDESITLRD
jgi:tetratricopeptide (TPR) repeat protein